MDTAPLPRQLTPQHRRDGTNKRTRLETHWMIVVLVSCLVILDVISTVNGQCTSSVTELWAYSNPSTEDFFDSYKRFINTDKGSHCQWLIISSHKEEVVELYFSNFRLKNSSGTDTGDCLMVYDGPSESDAKLLSLCNGAPQNTYMSSGREMLVVYERGDRSGDRSFRMVYVSKEVLSKARMIRIAGIIGACIFAVVLVFIILRATRCCRCLLQSKDEDGVGRDIGGSTLVTSARERDRLTTEGGAEGETTVSVAGMRREARRVQGSAASINRLGVSENSPAGAVTSSVQVTIEDGALAPLAGTGRDRGAQSSSQGNGQPEGGSVSSSDSDRMSSGAASRGEPEANELPPSYESLFLDENGDYPVEKPPEYSPPKHRRKHPPRRVHTFN